MAIIQLMHNTILVHSGGMPACGPNGRSFGWVPPELLRKYASGKPLFRPKYRPLTRRPKKEDGNKPPEPPKENA